MGCRDAFLNSNSNLRNFLLKGFEQSKIFLSNMQKGASLQKSLDKCMFFMTKKIFFQDLNLPLCCPIKPDFHLRQLISYSLMTLPLTGTIHLCFKSPRLKFRYLIFSCMFHSFTNNTFAQCHNIFTILPTNMQQIYKIFISQKKRQKT